MNLNRLIEVRTGTVGRLLIGSTVLKVSNQLLELRKVVIIQPGVFKESHSFLDDRTHLY